MTRSLASTKLEAGRVRRAYPLVPAVAVGHGRARRVGVVRPCTATEGGHLDAQPLVGSRRPRSGTCSPRSSSLGRPWTFDDADDVRVDGWGSTESHVTTTSPSTMVDLDIGRYGRRSPNGLSTSPRDDACSPSSSLVSVRVPRKMTRATATSASPPSSRGAKAVCGDWSPLLSRLPFRRRIPTGAMTVRSAAARRLGSHGRHDPRPCPVVVGRPSVGEGDSCALDVREQCRARRSGGRAPSNVVTGIRARPRPVAATGPTPPRS